MPAAKIILSIYGVLLLSGAYFGIKAGSKVSLIMGLVSGAIVLLGVYLTTTQGKLGYTIILATSAVLCLVFLMRLIKTGNFMPSGMLLLMSIVALIVSFLQYKK